MESLRQRQSPALLRFLEEERQRLQESNTWLAVERERIERMLAELRRQRSPYLDRMLAEEARRMDALRNRVLGDFAIRN